MTLKTTFLEREGDMSGFRRLDRATRLRLLEADREHRASVHEVFYTLVNHHIAVDIVGRDGIKGKLKTNAYDIAVAVGGDGTLFQLASYADRTPCMLVNSDPKNSAGVFATCTRSDFGSHFESFLSGKHKLTSIMRGEVSINGRRIRELFTNDVLICHTHPASLFRFSLAVNGGRHVFKAESSGLWVATPAGSTAAIFAAGGRIDDIKSRRLQYLIREQYCLRGRVYPASGFAQSLLVTSLTPDSAVYIDGNRLSYKLGMGTTVRIAPYPKPLNLVNYDVRTRRALIRRITGKSRP